MNERVRGHITRTHFLNAICSLSHQSVSFQYSEGLNPSTPSSVGAFTPRLCSTSPGTAPHLSPTSKAKLAMGRVAVYVPQSPRWPQPPPLEADPKVSVFMKWPGDTQSPQRDLQGPLVTPGPRTQRAGETAQGSSSRGREHQGQGLPGEHKVGGQDGRRPSSQRTPAWGPNGRPRLSHRAEAGSQDQSVCRAGTSQRLWEKICSGPPS